jgi:hypothetical protein
MINNDMRHRSSPGRSRRRIATEPCRGTVEKRRRMIEIKAAADAILKIGRPHAKARGGRMHKHTLVSTDLEQGAGGARFTELAKLLAGDA